MITQKEDDQPTYLGVTSIKDRPENLTFKKPRQGQRWLSCANFQDLPGEQMRNFMDNL